MLQQVAFNLHLELDQIVGGLIVEGIIDTVGFAGPGHIILHQKIHNKTVTNDPFLLETSVERIKLHLFDPDHTHFSAI